MIAIPQPPAPSILLLEQDLGEGEFRLLLHEDTFAWDIETTGLDWRTDRITTCQVATESGRAFVVRTRAETKPLRLLSLLADKRVRKVFHHAPFDLRFLVGRWGASPANIACTKVASKLLHESQQDHSLKTILKRHLGVSVDKGERLSDWLAESLTESQLLYAANDVRFLIPLLHELENRLDAVGRSGLALDCFRHLPTRAALEVGGFGDVFAY